MSPRRARISAKEFKKNNNAAIKSGPHNVIYAYQAHDINRETAIKKLSHMGVSGKLFAGQLLIEKSASAESADEAIDLLGQAACEFMEAENAPVNNDEARIKRADLFKSRLFLGYLPVYAYMITERTLPAFKAAESAYQKTVDIGYKVLEEIKQHDSSSESYKKRSNLVGLLGEISILGLTNRAAVYEIGSESYFAVPATVQFDRANRHGTTVDKSSDINVYCDTTGIDDPIYKLAIKSSDKTFDKSLKFSAGKSIRINVSPDLEKHPGELYVASEITKELYSEMSGNFYNEEFSETLDYRTEKMFDIFDNPPTNL